MMDFRDLKKNSKKDYSSLPVIKVTLLGDSATQFLATAIKGMGYEKGYHIDLFEAEYNQIERQILDPTSDLHAFAADYTIIFQSTHKLLDKHSTITTSAQSQLAQDRLDFVNLTCNSISGRIIYFNYPEIEDTVFGSFANKVESSFTYQLRKLNYELMNLSQAQSNLFICDLQGLQSKFGRDAFFKSSIYVNTEMLLSIDILPYVAARTLDIICAIEGKFKKCLIIDLDNTMWGGIVGDDGWENIQVGHGLGIGKAFTEFQHWIKKLKNRGIIIAICSKNDEDKAKAPFELNPEMVIKMDDISVFIANWDNKADNIR
ncbi:MAG: HAD-IIIC family phosphatase, partial [Pedobacter sp.]